MKIKLLLIALLIAITFPTYHFFLGNQMFTFNDEVQIPILHQFFRALDNGQFPPRWAPDVVYNYGSPLLEYNYQLPYYLGYLGHLAKLPLTTILKLLMAVSVIAGTLGMFFLGVAMTESPLAGLFAGTLYAYTPYQSIDHFVRGALGEVYALAILPWLFLSSYLLVKKISTRKVIFLGVSFGLLIISHQPAALITIPLITAVFVPATLFKKQIGATLAFFKSLMLGLALSAYYWIPVLLEGNFVKIGSPFNYKNQFPFLKQLIYSTWTYKGANPFSIDTFSFQIGIINQVVLFLATIVLVTSLLKKKQTTLENWIFRLVALAIFFIIFLMNIRSDFIWKNIPLLQQIQFPWRLLMFTTLLTSVLSLYLFKLLPKRIIHITIVALLILTVALNVNYFHPGEIVNYNDTYYLRKFLPNSVLFPGEVVSSPYLLGNEDHVVLPKDAVRPNAIPSSKLTSASNSTRIKIVKKGALGLSAIVNNSKTDILTYHSYNFPGWTVIVDRYPHAIKSDPLGAITFELKKGEHKVDIYYQETTVRLFSNIISLAALILIIAYSIYYSKLKRVTATT